MNDKVSGETLVNDKVSVTRVSEVILVNDKVSVTRVSEVFPVAQSVKSLPAIQETWVQSLGREDSLEKEMATHSSILAMENSMDRGAWWAKVQEFTKNQT